MDNTESNNIPSCPHTDDAVTMLQLIMQKVTALTIQSTQTRPEYYETMGRLATDLAYSIRNIEKDYDTVVNYVDNENEVQEIQLQI